MNPSGGIVFTGNAGLCSDAQACLEFGTWDWIGFENDITTWVHGAEVIRQHMASLDRREADIKTKLEKNMKLLPIYQQVHMASILCRKEM